MKMDTGGVGRALYIGKGDRPSTFIRLNEMRERGTDMGYVLTKSIPAPK